MPTILHLSGKWLSISSVVLLLSWSPVQAFYFKGWPGDGLPREQSLFSSKTPSIGGPSLAEEEQFPSTGVLPPGKNEPTGGSPVVPEPTSLLLAGIGLAILGLARQRKR